LLIAQLSGCLLGCAEHLARRSGLDVQSGQEEEEEEGEGGGRPPQRRPDKAAVAAAALACALGCVVATIRASGKIVYRCGSVPQVRLSIVADPCLRCGGGDIDDGCR
jgi:hypothetical protein